MSEKMKAPFCLNSKRYLDLCGWIIKACPCPERMRGGCDYCLYYEKRIPNNYYKNKLKHIEECFR